MYTQNYPSVNTQGSHGREAFDGIMSESYSTVSNRDSASIARLPASLPAGLCDRRRHRTEDLVSISKPLCSKVRPSFFGSNRHSCPQAQGGVLTRKADWDSAWCTFHTLSGLGGKVYKPPHQTYHSHHASLSFFSQSLVALVKRVAPLLQIGPTGLYSLEHQSALLHTVSVPKNHVRLPIRRGRMCAPLV
jgi:hypothetical protein